jgi:hypothetical protein
MLAPRPHHPDPAPAAGGGRDRTTEDDSVSEKYVLDGRTPRRVDDVREWGRWFESADRRVASTEIGPVRVSTVFLGLDHGFGESPRPIVFETMIFGSDAPALDHYQERYATWDEAEAGHARAVALVDDTLGATR